MGAGRELDADLRHTQLQRLGIPETQCAERSDIGSADGIHRIIPAVALITQRARLENGKQTPFGATRYSWLNSVGSMLPRRPREIARRSVVTGRRA